VNGKRTLSGAAAEVERILYEGWGESDERE
jgi:hypothetical protein